MQAGFRLTVAVLLTISLASGASATRAEMLPSTDLPATPSEQLAKQRGEIRARLEAHGVEKMAAQARVAALTDAEVSQLAARFDKLPAGGDARALLGVIGVVAIAYVVIKLLPLFLIGGAVAIAAKSANKNPNPA